MTESEWLTCVDPQPMLAFLLGRVSDRKLRLFACACCRRMNYAVRTWEKSRRAVEVTERFADELASREELEAACIAATPPDLTPNTEVWLMAAVHAGRGEPFLAAARAADSIAASSSCIDEPIEDCIGLFEDIRRQARKEQASILRDIAGNPFRVMPIERSRLWRDSERLTNMARSIYDEGRFEDIPLLADLMEEAGCAEPDMLAHCRGPVQHVRGCWVVDLLLGKH